MFRSLSLLLFAAFVALAASAGTKRALIVGVGDYAQLPDLQKTTGDATGYADVFSNDLGFEVTRLIDPTTVGFLEAQIATLHALGVESARIHAEVFDTGGIAT